MEDIDDPADDHRHINHLLCVYPGQQVTPSTTPELAGAAKVSLDARRKHGQEHPAWSRVWKACMFARLQDGDAAYGELSQTLATHVLGNLWAVDPPFQIDASDCGTPNVDQGVSGGDSSSGLVHGSEGAVLIDLLPALPAAWAKGRVTGMRARGGFELDIEWAGGQLVQACVRGASNVVPACTVRYAAQRITIAVACGDARSVSAADFASA